MTGRPSVLSLRLVVSNDQSALNAPTDQHVPQKNEIIDNKQYVLPLPEVTTAFIVQSSNVREGKLRTLIEHLKAKWIFDARPTPTFSTIAGTREEAFRIFEENSVKYVDVYGRLAASQKRDQHLRPEDWGAEVWDTLRHSKRKSGPFVFILNDATNSEDLEKTLEEKLEMYIGSEVRCTTFG